MKHKSDKTLCWVPLQCTFYNPENLLDIHIWPCSLGSKYKLVVWMYRKCERVGPIPLSSTTCEVVFHVIIWYYIPVFSPLEGSTQFLFGLFLLPGIFRSCCYERKGITLVVTHFQCISYASKYQFSALSHSHTWFMIENFSLIFWWIWYLTEGSLLSIRRDFQKNFLLIFFLFI